MTINFAVKKEAALRRFFIYHYYACFLFFCFTINFKPAEKIPHPATVRSNHLKKPFETHLELNKTEGTKLLNVYRITTLT